MTNKKPKIEFSKLIMVSVMLTYFIALVFMMAVIWQMVKANDMSLGTTITSFCTFVGAPISVAIGFYSWKAKSDNAVKLPYVLGQNDTVQTSYINENISVNENDGI